MLINLRTLGFAVATFAVTGSAFAVLPTVTLDPNTDPLRTAVASNVAPNSLTNTSITSASVPMSTRTLTTMPASQATAVTSVAAVPTLTQLQRRLYAMVVTRDAMGQEMLVPVNNQTPVTRGTVLEYRGYVINQSPERVRNMKVNFGLPANTELTSISDMSPSRAMGSLDGVNFQYLPLKTNIGGVLQDLPLSYYKALRWNIEGLGLNEVAEIKYRVRVK